MSEELPSVKVDGFTLPRIILGYDPFQLFTALYPDHREKKRIYSERFSSLNGIAEVITTAINERVNTLTFPPYRRVIEAVDHLRSKGVKMTLLPFTYQVPLRLDGKRVSVDRINSSMHVHREYIRQDPTYEEYLSSDLFRGIEKARPLTNREFKRLRIDEGKLRELLRWFSEKGCVKLFTTCVEFYALNAQFDLLDNVIGICDDEGFSICPGFHMSNVIDILEKENLHFPAYYAPLNKTGFFMLPSRESMLHALSKLKAPIIAIKPMSGGRIHPQEAFEYIFGLREDVICMIGVGSTEEARETIRAAKRSLPP